MRNHERGYVAWEYVISVALLAMAFTLAFTPVGQSVATKVVKAITGDDDALSPFNGDEVMNRARQYAVTNKYSIIISPRIQCAAHADASQHGCEHGDIEVFFLNDANGRGYTLHIRKKDERLTANN